MKAEPGLKVVTRNGWIFKLKTRYFKENGGHLELDSIRVAPADGSTEDEILRYWNAQIERVETELGAYKNTRASLIESLEKVEA